MCEVQPRSHLKSKPWPPCSTGRVTPAAMVESSAIRIVSGCSCFTARGIDCMKRKPSGIVAVAVVVQELACTFPRWELVIVELTGRVEAEAVDVVFLDPVEQAGDEKLFTSLRTKSK